MNNDIEMILEIWDLMKSNISQKDKQGVAEKYLELISGYGIDIEQHKEDFFDHCSILSTVIKEIYMEDLYDNYDEE